MGVEQGGPHISWFLRLERWLFDAKGLFGLALLLKVGTNVGSSGRKRRVELRPTQR
jgi:hypothetical protein